MVQKEDFFMAENGVKSKAGMHFSVLLVITIIDTNLATFFQALSFKGNIWSTHKNVNVAV